MPHAAVVVADGGIRARLWRDDGDFVGIVRRGVEVDAQRFDQQAVRAVVGDHADGDLLTVFERDDVGRKREASGVDLDHARVGRGGGEEQTEDERDHDKPPLSNCCTPSVPPISRTVSSTSSMASGAGPAARRSPRLRKGAAESKGSAFFSAVVAGSGKAKISERAAWCCAGPRVAWCARWMWP